MKMKHFALALLSLMLIPTLAFGLTVERSSARVAGSTYGFSPVLRITLDSGARQVVGLDGVSYLNAVDVSIPANILMYQQTAVAWVCDTYGCPNQVIQGNSGGGNYLGDVNKNGIVDPGDFDASSGGGSW